MKTSPIKLTLTSLSCLLLSVACAHKKKTASSIAAIKGVSATAQMNDLNQSGVKGELTITQVAKGKIHIFGEIKGLPPTTLHGFHIHEKGDCSAPDGSSAGAHFNPDMKPHGALEGATHLGDLGNITADEKGLAKISVTKNDTMELGVQGFVGRAFIVHANADDLKTQPSGDAGGRISCGVIALKP